MAKRASTSVIKRRSKSLAEYVGLLKKMSAQIDRFHHRTDCSEQSRSFHRIGPHRGGKNIVYSTRCLRSIAVSSDVSRNIRDPLGLGGIFDSGSLDDKLIGEECLCPTTRRMSTASRPYVPRSAFPRHFDFHLSNAVVASTRETDFSERKNASPVIGRIT